MHLAPHHIASLQQRLLLGFAAAAALFAMNALFNFPLQRLIESLPATFNFADTNIIKRSETLLVLLAWPLAHALVQRGRAREAWILLAGTAMLAPVFTGLNAALALFAGIVVVAMGTIHPALARLAGFVVLPLVFVAALAVGLSALQVQMPFSGGRAESGAYRLHIWDFTSTATLQHLPFGIGADGSRTYGERAQAKTPAGHAALPVHPHNVFLQIWLELGLIGAALGSALGFMIWRRFARAPAALQPYLFGYAATATVLLATAYGLWQAWWLAGHALAAFLVMLNLREDKPQ